MSTIETFVKKEFVKVCGCIWLEIGIEFSAEERQTVVEAENRAAELVSLMYRKGLGYLLLKIILDIMTSEQAIQQECDW